jgi:predicted ATPase
MAIKILGSNMLDNMTLKNFKSFKKLNGLKTRPITILCGANSCGKSTILQSLLLLKQTFESKNPNQTLLLNGRFTKLGYFKDLVYQKETKEMITLEFCFNISSDINDFTNSKKAPIHFLFKHFIDDLDEGEKNSKFLVSYKVSIQKDSKNESKESEYLKSIQIKEVKIQIIKKSNNKRQIISKISIINSHDNLYKVRWKDLLAPRLFSKTGRSKKSKDILLEIEFANLFPTTFKSVNGDLKDTTILNFNLIRLKDLFRIIFQSYTYIGPLRGEPEREYIYRDEIVEIGNKGENAAYLYLAEKDIAVRNHYFYDKVTDNFNFVEYTDIKSALNNWFELMKIQNFEAKILNKIIYLNLSASTFDNTEVGIADVGFGVSQIFPIILEGFRMDKGDTLLLEQPEIHLHPNLQMQLSDYFITLALSGKCIMAETHSEHIINRLVRRIVEDEKYNLKELISIYFIKLTDEGSKFEEVHIDDLNGITNWPIDFFDQTANEQMKIMQAGLRKRNGVKVNHGRNL